MFKKELGNGPHESIPLVYRGVMYLLLPGAAMQAIDATHRRADLGTQASVRRRARQDHRHLRRHGLLDVADGFIVALDARTGAVRWETKTSGRLTSGVIVVEGKVISGPRLQPVGDRLLRCGARREDRQGTVAVLHRGPARTSPAARPGAGARCDACRVDLGTARRATTRRSGSSIWGVANPTPNTRANRHGGNSDAIPTSRAGGPLQQLDHRARHRIPASSRGTTSTCRATTGTRTTPHERTLLRTAVSPDPKFVKWINPDVKQGEQRDVAAMVGEGGGIFALDRGTGQFLWATPFPFDTPNFLISNIDGKTGRVTINENVMFKGPSDRQVICYWNTRSYWPTAYHPAAQRAVRAATSRTAST